MKKILLIMILIFVTIIVIENGCKNNSSNPVTPPTSTTSTMHVISASGSSYSFSPNSITDIKIGDTMKFVWLSGNHTTTSTSVPTGASTWNNPLNSGSTSFIYIITKSGTYNYQCNFHYAMGMTGSFTVN